MHIIKKTKSIKQFIYEKWKSMSFTVQRSFKKNVKKTNHKSHIINVKKKIITKTNANNNLMTLIKSKNLNNSTLSIEKTTNAVIVKFIKKNTDVNALQRTKTTRSNCKK